MITPDTSEIEKFKRRKLIIKQKRKEKKRKEKRTEVRL
jgi:hypothetical protein